MNKEVRKKRKSSRKPETRPQIDEDSEGLYNLTQSSSASDSGEPKTDSTVSLNSLTDSRGFKVSLTTRAVLGNNYGGTSRVDGNSAEILASYGSAKKPLAANEQLFEKSGDSKQVILYQRNSDKTNKKAKKNTNKMIENEEYINELLHSHHEKNSGGPTLPCNQLTGKLAIQLRWASSKSVCLWSCKLGFDSGSGQTNNFKIGIHSFLLDAKY